jgi:hypothetical protein
MYFRDCKRLEFLKEKSINFRVQISPRVKTMHNAWISPPISLLNISVYRLQPRLFIDSLPYLKLEAQVSLYRSPDINKSS